jgi:glycosyltransferase involved in cell wall biosynthesis
MIAKDVDICITTYNRNDRLLQILHILSRQTNQHFNLIVNDDGSTQTIDPNQFPIITKYIWNKDQGYNRVGRFNESILLCVSHKIILLDDDCIPCHEHFITEHMKALEQADFSKGTVIFPDGATANSWFSTANIGLNRSVLHPYGLFYPDYNGHYGYEDMDLGNEIQQRGLSVISNPAAACNTGSQMYLNGDRSPAVIGRNWALYKQRWNK